MHTDTRLGSFDTILEASPGGIIVLTHGARAVIAKLDPDAHETPRAGERAISYGVGPSKLYHAYCYLMPQRAWLNLGFYHGAVLDDPAGLLDGSGKRLRHVKLRSLEELQAPALHALLLAAIAERQRAQR